MQMRKCVVQIRKQILEGTGQRKFGYRSENVGHHGNKSEKVWVQIGERR